MDKKERVFGLDLLRALAIIHVVLLHGAYLLDTTFLEGFPFVSLIDGVDIFFALSGFLIGSILLKSIHREEKFGLRQLGVFWKRRWFRTLPNYYLVLLANYIVVKYGIIVEYISEFSWKFFFFLQNFNKPFAGFFWESWTLTIEEWFYILSPVLLIVLLRFCRPRLAFLLMTLVMIAAPFIHRICIYDPAIDYNYFGEVTRKLVVNRLDSIAYGLLAAWTFFYFPAFWSKTRVLSLILGISLMVFILNYHADHSTFYAQVFLVALSPLSAMLLIPYAEGMKKANGLFARAVTHISIISYSMYLINGALVSEVIRDNFPPQGAADRIIKYILFWAVTIIASTLLYRFFEKPMMNLREVNLGKLIARK